MLDGQQSRLLAFEPSGAVKWAVHETGEAPSSLSGSSSIGASRLGIVYALTRYGTRIESWEGNTGEYLGGANVDLDGWIPDVISGVHPTLGVLVTGPTRAGDGMRIAGLHPSSFEVTQQFDVVLPGPTPSPSGPSSIVDIGVMDELIAVGSNRSYEARLYNTAGEVRRTFARDVDYPKPPVFTQTDRSTTARHDFGMLRAPMRIGNDAVLIYASWDGSIDNPRTADVPQNDASAWDMSGWQASFDVFSNNGDLVTSQPAAPPLLFMPMKRSLMGFSDDPGFPLASTPGPDSYWVFTSSTEPFVQVRRYAVRVERAAPPGNSPRP